MRKVFTRVATAVLLSVAALVTNAQEVAYQLVIPDDPVTNQIELTKNEDVSYTIHFVGNDPFIQLAALTRDLTDEETYLTYEYQLDQKINSDMEIFFSPISQLWSLPAHHRRRMERDEHRHLCQTYRI